MLEINRSSKNNYTPIPKIISRLQELKVNQFLREKIFPKLSENMHYETFKYLNSRDLLEIRCTKLGGYQLVSNKILRSRIKNYFTGRFNIKLSEDVHGEKIEYYDRRVKLIFEQTGMGILDLEDSGKGVIDGLIYLMKNNAEILELKLGIYIYIYIYTYAYAYAYAYAYIYIY